MGAVKVPEGKMCQQNQKLQTKNGDKSTLVYHNFKLINISQVICTLLHISCRITPEGLLCSFHSK